MHLRSIDLLVPAKSVGGRIRVTAARRHLQILALEKELSFGATTSRIQPAAFRFSTFATVDELAAQPAQVVRDQKQRPDLTADAEQRLIEAVKAPASCSSWPARLQLVLAAEVGHDPVARPALVVAVGLDQAQVA